jgi:hypothetical protein
MHERGVRQHKRTRGILCKDKGSMFFALKESGLKLATRSLANSMFVTKYGLLAAIKVSLSY